MSQLEVIERLSAALGVRIRKATRPDYFTILRALVDRFEMFGLDERMDLAGYQSGRSVFETDSDGNVISLELEAANNSTLDQAMQQVQQLTALSFLAVTNCKLTVPAARQIARLPRLRYLVTELGREGDDVLSLLGKSTDLEALLLTDHPEGLDVAPVRRFASLRALGFPGNKALSNVGELANCPALRHLALSGESLANGTELSRLVQLETLYVGDQPSRELYLALTSLRQLRSLHVADAEMPLEVLRELQQLRTIQVEYTEESLDPLLVLPHLEAIELKLTNIGDLSALRRFRALSRVSIRDGKTKDLSGLQGLETLTFLDVSENPIERVPDQLAMPNLRHLEWTASGDARLEHARFLSSCQNLLSLNLEGHALTDLEFLQHLGNVRELNLAGNPLATIEPLSRLPNLTALDISGSQVRSLAPLAQSGTLTHLTASRNPIDDVSALDGLFMLEDLELEATRIRDLAFTKRLRNLYKLNVARNEIDSLEPLLALSYIAEVDLSGNKIRTITRETIEGLRSLESLTLEGNPIEGIDRELFSGSGKVALTSLRDYFRGLSRGSVKHDQVKLLLVGNGRVGKTSLVNRLIDDTFDSQQPSTHGIQLRRWSLEHAADDRLDGRPLQINVWDFGGQDIYHATHRLFMRTRALFLLVWDRQTEHEAYSLDEFGERYENFPLPYWIDYIKALAGSPVVIVQNKVDSLAERERTYGAELEKGYPPPNGIVDYLYVSARRAEHNGIDALTESIKSALASLGSIGYALPAQWVLVRDRLAAMDRRYIEYAEFQELCTSVGMQGAEHISLVLFLHQAGALFYQPKEFGERIILDQRWAIDAVYALFDRRGAAYRDLRAAGRNGLTLEMLKRQVWRNFSEDEHRLLLEFMRSCELCFEFSPGRYYVPQLLPDEKPSRVNVRWKETTPYCLQISYAFLHRAIIDRFLVRAGLLGADVEPEIWKNGIVIYDARSGTEAMVEAFPDKGHIFVQARGDGALRILRMIRKEFDELRESFPATIAVSVDGGLHFVDLGQLQRHMDAGSPTALSTQGVLVDIGPLSGFLVDVAERLPKGTLKSIIGVSGATSEAQQPAGPETFISYAWGDTHEQGESREAIVDRLYDTLVARKYRVIRDKQDNGYRRPISDFMHRMGKGKLVVTVISDKYLKSPYCMFELLEIYRNGAFRERVFPLVLADAKLHALDERLAYVLHWKNQKRKIEGLMQEIGLDAFSAEGTFLEYDRYYREVFNNIDKLMALLADWNSLTPQLLEENSFDRLVTAIGTRITER